MSPIYVEHNPSPAKLEVLGVYDWPIWNKEESTLSWTYDQPETCYILRGEAMVTPADGGTVLALKRGDLVTFPAGFSCTWQITKAVRKHYRLQ